MSSWLFWYQHPLSVSSVTVVSVGPQQEAIPSIFILLPLFLCPYFNQCLVVVCETEGMLNKGRTTWTVMWRLFKHWLHGATTKAYFRAVKVADLQLTGNDCVSHAPAGCSVLPAQPRGRRTITFSTKGHQFPRSNLHIVFSSLLHVGSCVTRSHQETAGVFLLLTDIVTSWQVASL